jgi:hypothetical protein
MWPINPVNVSGLSEDDPEIRKEHIVYVASAEQDIFDKIFARRSSWYKLKKGFAWLLRIRAVLRNKIRGVTKDVKSPISVTELEEAEIQAVKIVQQKAFPKEFSAVTETTDNQACGSRRGNVSKSSQLFRLEPLKLKDGLLRVGWSSDYTSGYIAKMSLRRRLYNLFIYLLLLSTKSS